MTTYRIGPSLLQRPGGIPTHRRRIRVLCPVCLQPAETDHLGVVENHLDSMGHDCPMSGRVGPTWDEDSTRPAVRGRSGGICEYCSQHLAQDMHHRKSLGVGGRWHPANILHICRGCHRFITEHPNWAWALGLIVKSTEDPSQRVVIRENATQFQPTDDVTMPIPKRR
jgi:5-methylcytosine-specific restriction endonuclease McrA